MDEGLICGDCNSVASGFASAGDWVSARIGRVRRMRPAALRTRLSIDHLLAIEALAGKRVGGGRSQPEHPHMLAALELTRAPVWTRGTLVALRRLPLRSPPWPTSKASQIASEPALAAHAV